MQPAIEFARRERERQLNELLEFLKIPSISTLPEHQADIEKAADWLASQLRQIGVPTVNILATDGYPIVYGEWLNGGEGAPTVLVYGHYDVQPVDPLALWVTPPFEPNLRDGKVFARGAADDKGQMFIHVKAIEALLKAENALPVNIKMLFEGEEEIGSPSLEAFIQKHKNMLAADIVLLSDTDMLTPEQPKIVYGLRGLAAVEVHVKGPERDLHSGVYGGTVLNPAQLIAKIIAHMHDDTGRVQVPEFYSSVRPLSAVERQLLGDIPYELENWQEETGLKEPWGEADFSLVERMGARPTLETNGIWGGFQGEGTKTIIPAEVGAKFTMRLVPDQDPVVIGKLVADFIQARIPNDFQADIKVGRGGWWAITPIDSIEMQAARKACLDIWGVEPVFARSGGSIPVVAAFQKEINAPSVMIGFSLPDDNIHAPNESFRVNNFYHGIEAVLRFYSHLIAEYS